MSLPATYTEATLAEYMHSRLGGLVGILGWDVMAGAYDEAVNAALLAYGVTDIAQATNLAKLRALAVREAWRAAADAVSHLYDVDADGSRRSRSQLVAQVAQALARAEALCLPYEDAWSVTSADVEHDGEPDHWTLGGLA